MFCFITKYFKKQPSQKVILTVDLSRWNSFLSEPDSSINSILKHCHISDVSAALVHTDYKTKQRFINSAHFLEIFGLENAIRKKQGLSQFESDKAKLVLLSTYEAKGFTPLPGFQHL